VGEEIDVEISLNIVEAEVEERLAVNNASIVN